MRRGVRTPPRSLPMHARTSGRPADGGEDVRRDETSRRVDAIRAQSSELENHLIDEYSAGRVSRREFIRRGSVIGMSFPLVGFLASACGTGKTSSTSGGGANTAAKAGGKQV